MRAKRDPHRGSLEDLNSRGSVSDESILSPSYYIFLLDQSDCLLHKPAIDEYPARSS